MLISKEVQFDYGHRVPFHTSKCRNLHGHRGRVIGIFDGPVVPDEDQRPDSGMVVDFGVIKTILMEEVHDWLDHAFVMWEDDSMHDAMYAICHRENLEHRFVSVTFIPTAENLANACFDRVGARLHQLGSPFVLREIRFYETPTSCVVADLHSHDGVRKNSHV